MGYLVVNRLNISLARWNNGAQTAAMMGSKWSEAQAILAAFLHSEAENADAAKKRELIEAEKEAMHLFSLLHAIALTNLSQTTGQVYGRISPDGAMHFKAFRSVPKETSLQELQNVIDGAEVRLFFIQ